MRLSFTFLIVEISLFFHCSKDLSPVSKADANMLIFKIDKNFYNSSDIIHFSIQNNSAYDLIIGLRCGVFLETDYQQWINDHWSENLMFWFMYLLCPTFYDTIFAETEFQDSISADFFPSSETYRFVLKASVIGEDTTIVIPSNSFKVKK